MQVRYGYLSEEHRETLEAPITVEELRTAVFKGDSKKSSGKDGIGLEFFKTLWDDIANKMRTLYTRMLQEKKLSEKQKHGIIVCIPKKETPKTQRTTGP